MVKIGKYNYEKSPVKNKKLRVIVNDKKIDFGDTRYQHFKDKTKIFSNLDHNDEKRRKNYLTRTANQKDGKGNLTKNNPLSANYHARRILWNA
tara:strand:- start:523 stop:801 length:279 start_codon:yes stop_codon:yes gene_type:complete